MAMAKLRVIRGIKKKGVITGILKLNIVMEKIQKGLLHNKSSSSSYYCYKCDDDCEEGCGNTSSSSVPEDVKAGHFAVIAASDGDGIQGKKRFIVPLSFLKNPRFLRMLEGAAEEYGFDQDGAITIPCRPSELDMLLAQQWQEEGDYETDGIKWKLCDKAMVKREWYNI